MRHGVVLFAESKEVCVADKTAQSLQLTGIQQNREFASRWHDSGLMVRFRNDLVTLAWHRRGVRDVEYKYPQLR